MKSISNFFDNWLAAILFIIGIVLIDIGAFYFNVIMFLDNSFILSDSVCSLASILTKRYMLRVMGNPTEAIRFCKSNSIKYTPFKIYKDKSYAT